jgi:hypothetical protein
MLKLFMSQASVMVTKRVDSQGRIRLDKSRDGASMLVEERDDGSIVLYPATKSKKSAKTDRPWVFANEKAFASLMDGIDDARDHRFVPAPDLRADRGLLQKLGVDE